MTLEAYIASVLLYIIMDETDGVALVSNSWKSILILSSNLGNLLVVPEALGKRFRYLKGMSFEWKK